MKFKMVKELPALGHYDRSLIYGKFAEAVRQGNGSWIEWPIPRGKSKGNERQKIANALSHRRVAAEVTTRGQIVYARLIKP